MKKLTVKTQKREELHDITSEVQKVVDASGLNDGICHVYIPHTTAAVAVQEGDDPAVGRDIMVHLRRLFPREAQYEHNDGNMDAHLKAILVGNAATVLIDKGKLCLGTWQSVFLCEFDGPRTREVWVKVRAG
jgi:secondary thiamine-phosphate synthase enzyme